MSATSRSDRTAARRIGAALLSRFALVGIASTVLYGVLAMLLSKVLPAVQASFLAYAAGTVFSYVGHKFVTFASDGAHRAEAPRFLITTAVGFSIATALPALLTSGLGWPAAVPILLTCIVIPPINLVVLNWWVFARRDVS